MRSSWRRNGSTSRADSATAHRRAPRRDAAGNSRVRRSRAPCGDLRIFGLERGTGTITVGAPADLVVCDAPAASLATDALGAIARGDIPGISCVIIDGHVRVARSRNTPLAKRLATVTGVGVPGAGH